MKNVKMGKKIGNIEPFTMIKGIFYAQFDNILGPKVVHQYPENVLPSEYFDAISDFVITKSSLCGRVISLFVAEFKTWVVGVPVCLSHTKYPRNALIFNMALLIDSEHPMLEIYFPSIDDCVRKLSNYLTSLEREREYLFNQTHTGTDVPNLSTFTQDHGSLPLPEMMKLVYDSLNKDYACKVNIDPANTIFIRLYPLMKDPDIVMLHHVPVPIHPSSSFKEYIEERTLWDERDDLDRSMDIGMKKILPFIDGVAYVKKIAFQADMDVDLVIKAIKHLLYYGYVGLTDIFQYSNKYMVTPGIQKLYTQEELQQACLVYVIDDPSKEIPKIQTIFKLYAMYNANNEVKMIYHAIKEHGYNIDIKKLTSFGVLNQIIRRLHPYPVGSIQQQEGTAYISQTLQQMADGKHHLDEIAVTFNMSYNELEPFFEKVIYM